MNGVPPLAGNSNWTAHTATQSAVNSVRVRAHDFRIGRVPLRGELRFISRDAGCAGSAQSDLFFPHEDN